MKINNHHQSPRVEHESHKNKFDEFERRSGGKVDKVLREGMHATKFKLEEATNDLDGKKLSREDKRHLHDLKRAAVDASHAWKQHENDAKKEVHKKRRTDPAEGAEEPKSKSVGKEPRVPDSSDIPSAPPVDDTKAAAKVPTERDVPNAAGSLPRPSAATQIPPIKGETVLQETIVVKAGTVFDGKGMHYIGGKGIGDGGQGEGQKPLFILEPGATLKNVQISGGDGVHAKGDAHLENVWWRDVGEDAFTKKGEGDVTIKGGGALNASDKVFQVNAGGSLSIDGFYAKEFSKFIRQNGGKDFPLDVSVTNSYLDGGKKAEAVFRTDSKQASVTLSNNQLVNVKNDVLAPDGAKVVGAVSQSYKSFSG